MKLTSTNFAFMVAVHGGCVKEVSSFKKMLLFSRGKEMYYEKFC